MGSLQSHCVVWRHCCVGCAGPAWTSAPFLLEHDQLQLCRACVVRLTLEHPGFKTTIVVVHISLHGVQYEVEGLSYFVPQQSAVNPFRVAVG